MSITPISKIFAADIQRGLCRSQPNSELRPEAGLHVMGHAGTAGESEGVIGEEVHTKEGGGETGARLEAIGGARRAMQGEGSGAALRKAGLQGAGIGVELMAPRHRGARGQLDAGERQVIVRTEADAALQGGVGAVIDG